MIAVLVIILYQINLLLQLVLKFFSLNFSRFNRLKLVFLLV